MEIFPFAHAIDVKSTHRFWKVCSPCGPCPNLRATNALIAFKCWFAYNLGGRERNSINSKSQSRRPFIESLIKFRVTRRGLEPEIRRENKFLSFKS